MNKILLILLSVCFFTTGLLAQENFEDDSYIQYFALQFFGGMGPVWGEIVDIEKDLMNDLGLYAEYTDGHREKFSASHSSYHYGIFMDITPLNGSSYVFGMRTMYTRTKIDQELSAGGGESSDGTTKYQEYTYSGTYMEFTSLVFGPIFTYVFSDKKELTCIRIPDITVFFLVGPILSGKLSPGVAIQDFVEEETDDDLTIPSTDFSGFRLNAGIGCTFSYSQFDCGLNMYYSYNKIKTTDEVYVKVSNNTSFHEFSFELFAGFHI